MLLSLSIIGFFLSLIFIFYNYKKCYCYIFLGLFYSISSLYVFIQYVLLYSESKWLIAVFYLNFAFLSYLAGPFLFFYVRGFKTGLSKIKKRDYWHFLPSVIILIATTNHIFSPWPQKMAIADQILSDRNFIWKSNFILVNYYYPIFINFLSRPLLIFIYSAFSLKYLIKKSSNESLKYELKVNKKWLIILLSTIIAISFLQVIQILLSTFKLNINPFLSINFIQISSVILLSTLIILPFLNPKDLYGLKNNVLSPNNETECINNNVDEKRNFSFKLLFDENYTQIVEQKVNNCMKKNQPYLRAECNISLFAKLIKIPTHHLLYYFKEIKKQSFNDFRNELRVMHAAKLMNEGKANKFTMEAIGQMSGFSSRNTFFKVFKKHFGVSPGNFVQKK